MPRHTARSRGPRDLGRFFVESPDGGDGGVPRLAAAERDHALRVLRAAPGDRLEALDGAGRRWPLEVVGASRRELELRATGPPEVEPAPGTAGAPLPALRIAVAVPRPGRLEPMLDRLTQLGAAAIQPLRCAWTGADQRWPRRDRLERVLREAVKQSGRAWLPTLGDPLDVDTWASDQAPHTAVLHPGAAVRLTDWVDAAALDAPGGAVDLVIGPEGGFREDELAALTGAGAVGTRLGAHILRIETAAEAALAVAVARLAP